MNGYKYSRSLKSGCKRSGLMIVSMIFAKYTPDLLPIGIDDMEMGLMAQIAIVSGVWSFLLASGLNWLKKRHGIDFWAVIGNMRH